MSRQVVVDMVLGAYSLEKCRLAEEALMTWMTAHPNDFGLYEIAGQLGIVKEAAVEREAKAQPESTRSPRRVLATQR